MKTLQVMYDLSFPTMCAKDYNVLEEISDRFVNCMTKNFMRSMCVEDNHNPPENFAN